MYNVFGKKYDIHDKFKCKNIFAYPMLSYVDKQHILQTEFLKKKLWKKW